MKRLPSRISVRSHERTQLSDLVVVVVVVPYFLLNDQSQVHESYEELLPSGPHVHSRFSASFLQLIPSIHSRANSTCPHPNLHHNQPLTSRFYSLRKSNSPAHQPQNTILEIRTVSMAAHNTIFVNAMFTNNNGTIVPNRCLQTQLSIITHDFERIQ